MNAPVEMKDKMTCQICGRIQKIQRGLLSHHGFTRPGDGWQTRSCKGARKLPLEVSNDVLVVHVSEQKHHVNDLVIWSDMPVEAVEVTYKKHEYLRGVREDVVLLVTKDAFDEIKAANERHFSSHRIYDWSTLEAKEKARRKHVLNNEKNYLAFQEDRLKRSDEALNKRSGS